MKEVATNSPLKCTLALSALHSVVDPEIGLNIVDLGLIYRVDFDEPNESIICQMTLTTRYCPMGESIREAARDTLKATFSGYEVTMALTFEPSWDHSRISEEGIKFLNRKLC